MSFCRGTCRALKAGLRQKPHPISINTSHNSAETVCAETARREKKMSSHEKKSLHLNLTLQQVTCSRRSRILLGYWIIAEQLRLCVRWQPAPQKITKNQSYCDHRSWLGGLKSFYTCVGVCKSGRFSCSSYLCLQRQTLFTSFSVATGMVCSWEEEGKYFRVVGMFLWM